MDYFSHSTNFTSPLHSAEFRYNIQEHEKAAKNALRKINLLYSEIMTPKNYDSEDLENHNTYESEENISHSYTTQNHYVRTCCSSVKELCVKCDKFVSQCTTCNQCECCTNDKNLGENSCKKKPGDYYHPSNVNFNVKCTVPKPFSFCAKIEDYQKAKENKIFKIKQDLERKIENELKVRVNFKPVPKSTHLPLYNQMIQEEKQRKVKRREECQEKLNNTKPFDLHSSKTIQKAKSSNDLHSENSQFRAKPIPKHILSNKVSEKFKKKEEIRKLLVSERAKQTIENSTLPFSQKSTLHRQTHSCVDLSNCNKTHNKKVSKPKDISEITKRLYVKKCSITMENWNKKVLQVNTDKEKINQKIYNPLNEYVPLNIKQLTIKETLPFMYFPVRMSNASLLREKQIREEMEARKEKEKIKDEEVIKRRFNNDILHKLKSLIPPSKGEKEIEEKIKNYRISQSKRQQEYEKELEEILKKVSEQNLLLERQLEVKQMNLSQRKKSHSNKGNESEESESEANETEESKSKANETEESESNANETQESISSNSFTDSPKS